MTPYEKKIKIILEDLYQIDPSLKEHEEALRKAIHALISARPDAELDEAFRLHLREELLMKASHMHFKKARPRTLLSWMRTHRTFAYATSGTLAATLIVLVSVLTLGGPATPGTNSRADAILSGAVTITPVAEQAFGPLLLSSAGEMTSSMTGGMGGGLGVSDAGGGGMNDTSAKGAPSEEGTATLGTAPEAGMGILGVPGVPSEEVARESEISEKMIAPYEPTIYTYTYTGDPLAFSEEKVGVLRRSKNANLSGSALNTLLGVLNIDLLDLSSFPGLGLRNFAAVDKDEKYYITVDLAEEMVSISPGMGSADMAYSRCIGEHCMPRPLTMNDVPADGTLISLATRFVSAHGIGTSHYGAPAVDSRWKSWTGYGEGGEVYVPDSISVIYPLVIEGENVYGESGDPIGMSVNVNIRSKEVTGVWDITSHRYERSLYTAETDMGRILKIASQGGYRQYYPYFYDEAEGSLRTKKIDLKIGTPELVYMKFWKYDEAKGTSDELMVPAFAFPVVSEASGGDIPPASRIIVPLAKELLDQMETEPKPLFYQ